MFNLATLMLQKDQVCDADSFLILLTAVIAWNHLCHLLLARIPFIQAVSRVIQCSLSLSPDSSHIPVSQGWVKEEEAVILCAGSRTRSLVMKSLALSLIRLKFGWSKS